MELNIERALNEQGTRFGAQLASSVKVPEEFGFGFVGEVRVPLEFFSVEDQILVEGHIEALVEAACDRCLERVELPLTVPFLERFSKTQSDEEDTYLYEGEEICLDKLVLDDVALALPTKILCSEDCQGICPVCGKNRNVEQCGCENNDRQANPFARLAGLFDDDEEV